MAFYQDRDGDKKKKTSKERLQEGGWEEEGARYRGAPAPGVGRKPGFSSAPGARGEYGKRYGAPGERAARPNANPYGRDGQRAESRDGFHKPGKGFATRPAEQSGDRPYARGGYGNARPAESGNRFAARPAEQNGDRSYARGGYGDARPAQPGRPVRDGQRSYARGQNDARQDRPAGRFGGEGFREKREYGDRQDNRREQGNRYGQDNRRPAGRDTGYGERRGVGVRRNDAPSPARTNFRPANDIAPQKVYEPDVAQEPYENMPRENLLTGRNPIREALKAGRDLEKLLVAKGDLAGSAREIVAMAKEQHIVVQEVDRLRLDAIAENHQGMIAFASAYKYATVEDMLALAAEREQPPLLVILDGITDPHNLGAIIRTAECAGAHGVIVPQRRSVGLTPAAVKASSGAVEYLPVARVGNITRTIDELKKQGIWVYAADMRGETYTKVNFSGPLALVIGAEGEGVSRLVMENCDGQVSLPVMGKIDSLNASVAAGILLYAAAAKRQA